MESKPSQSITKKALVQIARGRIGEGVRLNELRTDDEQAEEP